jgi:integrase
VIASPDSHTTTARGLTAAEAVVEFDPLRDKSYCKTKLGPDVVAWLAWLEVGQRATKTIDGYERAMAKLCLMYPRLRIDQFTDAEVAQCIAACPRGSQRKRRVILNRFFIWARRTRRVTQNPVDLLPDIRRTPQKWIDVFSPTEVQDIYDAHPVVDRALLALLFEAGIRQKEARELQVRRLKLEPHPEVIVVGGKGGKDRVIPMTRVLEENIRALLLLEQLGPMDYLWWTRPGGGTVVNRNRPMGEASFQRWWRRMLSEAGIRYRNPHVARHTFATNWLRGGGRITTLAIVLGHASSRTAVDLYGHLDTRDVIADLALIQNTRTPD